jgi:hypothetical protein
VQTDQDKAALRSLFELKDLTGSSVDLYFGPTAPKDQEARWIKTAPGKAGLRISVFMDRRVRRLRAVGSRGILRK